MIGKRGSFLVDTAAEVLRTGIASGRWNGFLPGIHQLRVETDFGRSTLEKALADLADEGVIAEAKHGQRRAILRMPAVSASLAQRRLGLMFPMPWHEADREDVEFVSSLRLALEREGGELAIHHFKRSPNVSFGDVLRCAESNLPDAWAIYRGTRRLVEECMLTGSRTIAIGGPVKDLAVDIVAWDGDVLVTRALEMLLKAGHRRIVLPVIPSWRDGEHGGVRAFQREMARAGILLQPSFHLPDVPEGNDAFPALLERLWRLTPPTAIIVQNAAQVVAAVCFASGRGLSVPEDLSIIALCSNPLLREMRPAITSLSMESSKLVPHVVKWFVKDPVSPRKILLDQVGTIGDSIAPPPKGGS